ncbi:MAG: glycosyltransferase family 2 protein [Alphaproteobacteria bacterium]|nr:glycosyltransferase family 2 protein [Alphaproteobacteria bacterium]
MIKFSVIMPTYNRAFCIGNAIRHILGQSYSDFELLIIDDGSTDNTYDFIMKNYSAELKSGKIVYYKIINNAGVCAARNMGLRLAKNDWIVYCDTDNTVRSNFLDVFANAIKSFPNTKTFYAKFQYQTSGTVLGQPFDFMQLCRGNYIDMGVFCHHRSLVDEFGGFDMNIKRLVDYDLILTYTRHYTPVFIDEVIMDYNDKNDFRRITNSEDGNMQYIYKKHGINIKKTVYPKWIARIICCFIPSRRNRNSFMINHVKYKAKK